MKFQRLASVLTLASTLWLCFVAPVIAAESAAVPKAKADVVPYDPTRALATPAPAKPVETKPTEPAIQIPPATTSPIKRIGPAPVPSKTKTFLWEVKSPTNTLYLFGTIHVGKKAFYPLPEQVETAFDNSARLVVEADVSDQAATGDVSALVSYKSPDTIDKHIPLPLFERLKAQLVRLRIPTYVVQPMKPFVAGGFLSVAEFSRLGYDMNLGVDSYLISRAKQAMKPISELESARAQLELLNNMPPELQEAFLDNSITTLETGKATDQVTGMVNAWQTGDTKLMADVTLEVNSGMNNGARLDEILLYGRHDAMVRKIISYLDSNDIHFVAVGSLHLVGPRGLVQSLKNKGYEVKQK